MPLAVPFPLEPRVPLCRLVHTLSVEVGKPSLDMPSRDNQHDVFAGLPPPDTCIGASSFQIGLAPLCPPLVTIK